MARTFIRQDTQIRNSDTYDDTLAAGSSLETAGTEIEYDLNGLRSQTKRAIWADAAGDWFADIPTVNGKKRAIAALNTDLDDIEEKKLLFRAQILTDIAVPGGQNFVVLSVVGNEAPTQVRAVALTQNGAVTANSAFSGGAFAAHELVEIAGATAISPKNLCVVRDAATGQPIQSAGRDVFALLQGESTGVDGTAFDDASASNRVKISFVRMNAALDDLEACPVADIAGKTVNYVYVRRINFDAIPENAFLGDSAFIDQAASVDVTLDNAVDNQGGPVTQVGKNVEWRVDDTFKFAFQDSSGGTDILAVKPAAGGDEVEMNLALFDVNNSQPADFSGGSKFATSGTEIDVGVNPGVIETTGANDLRLHGAGELYLDDGNQVGSTWAQTSGIKLSETMAEWDAFEAAYGEVSLLNAIVQAKNSAAVRGTKTFAVLTANAAPNTDVGGVGGGTNLDVQLPNMSTGNFLTDYDVFLNGTLLRPGVNSAANHDYYPGTSLANGQLRFEFQLKSTGAHPDVLCVIPYA